MTMGLTPDQIAAYERDGYLGPIRVYSEAEMRAFRRRLDDLQARHPAATAKLDLKAHLVCPWLDAMIRNPIFLDVAESLCGPDLLCWTSSFRFKKPNSPTFAGWHQDTMYIKVEPAVTFWLAFTPATRASGTLRVIPGSHKWPLLPHKDTRDKDSILTRGQYITADFDQSAAVHAELAPGEAAIFHHNLVHSSGPNTTDEWRILFLPSYMPTWAVKEGARDCATLVRGTDRHRHFDHEPRCPGEMTPDAIEVHRRAVEYAAATMYDGSERTPIALT